MTIHIIGIPSDESSSFMRGPAQAPPRIRQVLNWGSANMTSELGIDLGDNSNWQDMGDVEVGTGEQGRLDIETAVSHHLSQADHLLTWGGDHAITYPIIRAYAQKYPDLTIVQLDAHPDLYDSLDGDRYSHACPFARIMEEGLVKRLVQVGIRCLTGHQQEQAEKFGVEIISAWEWQKLFSLHFDGPVYISLDLDVFDPAYAPGVSHHEPGGLTSRDVLSIIQTLDANIVGADVVELNIHRDLVNMTAMLAAKCSKELLARMLSNHTAA
ncbi:MAG: agmatinase [Chloroflexota bacterium]